MSERLKALVAEWRGKATEVVRSARGADFSDACYAYASATAYLDRATELEQALWWDAFCAMWEAIGDRWNEDIPYATWRALPRVVEAWTYFDGDCDPG